MNIPIKNPVRNPVRNPVQCILLITTVTLLPARPAFCQAPRAQTQVVMATVLLSNTKSTGSGFILSRCSGTEKEKQTEFILVTAGHVFKRMQGNNAVVTLRKKSTDGKITKLPLTIKIRDGKKELWTRHPKQDVVAMKITLPKGTVLPELTLDMLATRTDLQRLEPGDLVRCVVFPHGNVFHPSELGYPVIRLGCIAGYPVTSARQQPALLVDYNAFEGDSGGPVYWQNSEQTASRAPIKIIGLIQGQHFFNQRYRLVYQSGEFRKRLGLAIAVNAKAIRETIDLVPH